MAQESDALILFEGKPTVYELSRQGPVAGVTSGSLAKVSFAVKKTIRDEHKTRNSWKCLKGAMVYIAAGFSER